MSQIIGRRKCIRLLIYAILVIVLYIFIQKAENFQLFIFSKRQDAKSQSVQSPKNQDNRNKILTASSSSKNSKILSASRDHNNDLLVLPKEPLEAENLDNLLKINVPSPEKNSNMLLDQIDNHDNNSQILENSKNSENYQNLQNSNQNSNISNVQNPENSSNLVNDNLKNSFIQNDNMFLKAKPVYPVVYSESTTMIRKTITELNFHNFVYNSEFYDRYKNSKEKTILLIQVHTRTEFLKILLNSLRQMDGIELE